MKAMQVHSSGPNHPLSPADLPQPRPARGEVLIRVCAAGVTITELSWYPTTHTKAGTPRAGAVPGHEFSGIVAAVGENAACFQVGDAVYGMNDWFADGATAEFCLTQPQNIALKPASLSHQEAATVPISALTAWQGLFSRANIKPGERVLVHGGAGAVGLFAVQLAHLHGAKVIATASSATLDFVSALGADQVIDYRSSRFEDRLDAVDVVFDTVGGDVRDRSWAVLKPEGRMVTIASDAEATGDQRVKDAFLLVEANGAQLKQIAQLLDAGTLKAFVKAVVPLADASLAYSGKLREQLGYGKVVVSIAS
jgi:NADPH:quinone reductase-like Zn-dependent oxidoreductase